MACATTIYGFILQDKASDGSLQAPSPQKTYKKRTGSIQACRGRCTRDY